MKLFVPDIGDQIKLLKPWKFTLSYERRNDSLMNIVNPNWKTGNYMEDYSSNRKGFETSLPAGTILKCKRIYIRQGSRGWSSITWSIISNPTNSKSNKARFWAKLQDCNEIEFEINKVIENEPVIEWDRSMHRDTRDGSGFWYSEKEIEKLDCSDIVRGSAYGWIDGTRYNGGLKRFKIDCSFAIEKFKTNQKERGILRGLTLNKREITYAKARNVRFHLIDLETNETVGTWKSDATPKKKAKEILKKIQN
jgi:hypothetical protein